MLFSDKQIYNQINRIYMAKKDASMTFCEFLEKLLHFHLPHNMRVFSITVFRLLPSLIYFLFIDS